ncbi:MAG: hypothetical protein J5I47_12720 [Vicingus serpentipes]|nr:hypothetical protein [Vicingus serpentipes]
MSFNFSTPITISILLIAAFNFSCSDNRLDIDVSNVQVELKIKHFEKDLFQYQSNFSPDVIQKLNAQYPNFFKAFTQNVINIGNIEHPSFPSRLNSFVLDPDINNIQKEALKLYGDFSVYEAELKNAFQYYKYYFPKKPIPEIITYISGFNYAVITDDNYLGIGLDMFLGKDYHAYPQLGYPMYKIYSMTKENLVVGAMTGWITTEFELTETQADLLTEMIHQGKILYLLDALMPQTENALKVNYTLSQLSWCENNEEQIWFYFIDNKLLYTKETQEIIKYMGEAPFTQGFPEGSPGRVGHWLGWQIVKAYMKNNPTITVQQLMQEKDAQKILNQSKYKP